MPNRKGSKLDPHRDEILAMRRKGITHTAIVGALGRRGIKTSVGGLCQFLSKGNPPAPTSPATPTPSPAPASPSTPFFIRHELDEPAAPPLPPAVPAPDPSAAGVTCPACGALVPVPEIQAELWRTLTTLRRTTEQAETNENPAHIISASRAITALIAQIDKMTPPPPQDPNEHPDMVRAAAECRELLMNAVRRKGEK